MRNALLEHDARIFLSISGAGWMVIAWLFIAIWSGKNELDDLKQQKAEAERTLDQLETKTKGAATEHCLGEHSQVPRVFGSTEKQMQDAVP